MSKKKIKVKVKKRKLSIKKIFIFLLTITLLASLIYYISKLPIKNIYIIGNNILSDKEIIELAGISDYPSFVSTSSHKIKNKLKSNQYIKNIEIKKTMNSKIYIYVTEKEILCTYDNKLLLEDSTLIENKYNINSYPILISDITKIKEKYISSFSKIENNILLKISEIEYAPNTVDSERFILKMNDGNLVYITLNKIEKINKYNSIYSSLEGKKGIIYLDSGDYAEIKKK